MGSYDKQSNAEFETGPREPAAKQANRIPVDYLYSKLNWDFIKLMAQIAQYAEGKYGAAEQYTESRLTGDKEPINHVFEHARQYLVGEDHDHFKTKEHQLAAIAYNAMMQYFYLVCGYIPAPEGLYAPRVLPPVSKQIFPERAKSFKGV